MNRLAGYLIHAPELVIVYGFAGSVDEGRMVYTDSDWGSCRTTLRSTSGVGVGMGVGGVVNAWGPRCKCVERDAGARRASHIG